MVKTAWFDIFASLLLVGTIVAPPANLRPQGDVATASAAAPIDENAQLLRVSAAFPRVARRR